MQWIIVTGDSGGLGSAIVRTILEDGKYGVIGISRRENNVVDSIKKKYSNYVHINFDLNNTTEVKRLYREEIRKIGSIYGLVNNSAMAYDDIVTNLDYEKLHMMYQINVYSPMMLTKYAIRDMILHKTQGSIIHISSVSAHTGYKGLAMYASTKGAMEAFSLDTAREWGIRGIRSNVVAPGFMETNISAKLTDEQKKKIYQRTALKKATDVQSVAEMVYFLLSDKASSITGTVVRVDNGTI